MKIKLIIIYIIIVVLLCVINYKISTKTAQPLENPIIPSLENTNSSNITSTYVSSAKFNQIKSAIDSFVSKYNKNDNVSVYYYDISTGEKYSFNEDKLFVAASLKKLPLVMEVLDKISAGELSLTDTVIYLPSDYSDGTGILQYDNTLSEASIDKLLQLCITDSDNIAYNMLNRICYNTLVDYADNNICKNCLVNDNGYLKTSAKSVYEMIYKLYSSQENNSCYSKVIDYMKHTQFNSSLNKYLPREIAAHKIGSYYRYYHDAAIIYGDDAYILVVLTKDLGILTDSPDVTPDQEECYLTDWGAEAFEAMAQLSLKIYEAE